MLISYIYKRLQTAQYIGILSVNRRWEHQWTGRSNSTDLVATPKLYATSTEQNRKLVELSAKRVCVYMFSIAIMQDSLVKFINICQFFCVIVNKFFGEK